MVPAQVFQFPSQQSLAFFLAENKPRFLQVLWQVPKVVFRDVGMGVVEAGDVFLEMLGSPAASGAWLARANEVDVNGAQPVPGAGFLATGGEVDTNGDVFVLGAATDSGIEMLETPWRRQGSCCLSSHAAR